jgi:hypothetical protein
MAIEQMANQDFDRAVMKGFWRKVAARLTGRTNDLLPYDDVRQRLVMQGQHYIGLRQVLIDQIIGSSGRYRDFDRAFLPLQTRTRQRWVSIDKAHYEDVILPPVELYKMGEVYFVKDGNHRVSVARERGQVFVDAYVTEIDLPVPMRVDSKLDDLVAQQELLGFMETTGLARLRPGALVEIKFPGQAERLLEHISEQRWYLGEQRGAGVSYEEAVASWYDNVYLPVVEVIREQSLQNDFPDFGEADLYLWITDYQWYLRRAYREEGAGDDSPSGGRLRDAAGRQVAGEHPQPGVQRLVSILKRADWIDDLILQQERAMFFLKSRLPEIRPVAKVEITVPGQYEKLLEHIEVHRWYLGEQRGGQVSYQEATASWYENVFLPLVQIIQEQAILDEFPGRTEADLYLWIISHQWYLRQEYGEPVTIEQAAEQFAEEYSPRPTRKFAKVFKKVTGKK